MFGRWAPLVFMVALSLNANPIQAAEDEESLLKKIEDLDLALLKNPNEVQRNIDSLFSSLTPEATPRAWMHAYFLASPELKDKAKITVDEIIVKAGELESNSLFMRAILAKADSMLSQDAPRQEVKKYYEMGRKTCEEWQNSLWCGRLFLEYATFHFKIHEYPEGLEIVQEALNWLKNLDDENIVYYHQAQNILALILIDTKQYKRAMDLTEVTYHWLRDHGYPADAAALANNLAMYIFSFDPKNMRKAKDLLDESLVLAKSVNDYRSQAMGYAAKAKILHAEERLSDAVVEFDKAKELAIKSQDRQTITYVFIHKTKPLIELKMYAAAKQTLDEASSYLNDDFKIQQMQILDTRRDIAELEGKYQLAYQYSQEYFNKWRTQTEDKEKRNMEKLSTQLGLQVEEERNKVLLHENELQSQKLKEAERFRIFVIILSALSLSTLVFLVLAVRQTRAVKISRYKMQRILDNIDEGLLTLDESQKITDDYSKKLPEIIGSDRDLAGQEFIKTVFSASKMPEEDKSIIHEILTATLGENQLAWDCNMTNLPREMRVGDGQKEKVIAIRWIPIYDSHDTLQRVLVSFSDITEERMLEHALGVQTKHLKALPDTLREILQAKPERFKQVLENCSRILREINKEGGTMEHLRTLHTQKGAARTLGLRALSQDLHELETLLRPDGIEVADAGKLKAHLDHTIERLAEYKALSDVLHSSDGPGKSIDYTWVAGALTPHLLAWQNQMQAGGHSLKEIRVRDGILDWSPENTKICEELCLHGINNSLEHGFLFPLQRGEKVEPVVLDVSVVSLAGTIKFELKDNGVGLNLEKLASIAKSKGFIPKEYESDADVVFFDGVSTADKLTLTSGRGVGLAAVKAGIEMKGGRIWIRNNEKGTGTLLQAEWPVESASPEAVMPEVV